MEAEKENIINLYVTPDERKRLEKGAEKAGMALPTWIRQVALKAAQAEDSASG